MVIFSSLAPMIVFVSTLEPSAMYIVKILATYFFYLGVKSWTGDLARAQKFATQGDAAAALMRMLPYTRIEMFRKAVIVPFAGEVSVPSPHNRVAA